MRAIYPFALLAPAVVALAAQRRVGNEFVMPPPDAVLDRTDALLDDGTLADQTLVTLGRVLTAYALALLVGVVLGTLVGRVAVVRRALRPLSRSCSRRRRSRSTPRC